LSGSGRRPSQADGAGGAAAVLAIIAVLRMHCLPRNVQAAPLLHH
jgi:hypothetical protein